MDAVSMILDLFQLQSTGEVLYDLGCGDARLLVEVFMIGANHNLHIFFQLSNLI